MEQLGLLHAQDRELSCEIPKVCGDVVEIAEVHCVQKADSTFSCTTCQLGVDLSESHQQLFDDDRRCPNEFKLV